jgi:signal transduction histidine kinase
VSDTGCGISPHVKHKIFDPYFTTKGADGSGLGLSVAYGILSRHEGKIEAKSMPGVGSTFNITIPILAETREGKQQQQFSSPAEGSISS